MKSFGFENDKIKSNGFKKFKGEKGKKYIVALVALSGVDGKDFFKGDLTHYHSASQKRFLCQSNDENGTKEICCTYEYEGSDPQWRVGCVIVVYKVNHEGKISGIEDVVPWIFNSTIFSTLKSIYGDHGAVDLSLECQDSTYQKFVILPKKGAAWKTDEKTKSYVLAQAKKQFDNLPKQIASKMGLGEIRELLGISSGTAGDAASDIDLSSISSTLPG